MAALDRVAPIDAKSAKETDPGLHGCVREICCHFVPCHIPVLWLPSPVLCSSYLTLVTCSCSARNWFAAGVVVFPECAASDVQAKCLHRVETAACSSHLGESSMRVIRDTDIDLKLTVFVVCCVGFAAIKPSIVSSACRADEWVVIVVIISSCSPMLPSLSGRGARCSWQNRRRYRESRREGWWVSSVTARRAMGTSRR